MCGKENPDELETCQFCQARLRPPAGELPQTPDQAGALPGSTAGEDVPDWLRSFRQMDVSNEGLLDGEETVPLEEEGSIDASGLPDWLSSDITLPPPPRPNPSAQKPEDVPDWLAGLDLEPEDASPSQSIPLDDRPPPQPGDPEPEWLRDLRERQGVEKYIPLIEGEHAPPLPEDEPDEREAPPEPAETSPTLGIGSGEGITDWLRKLGQANPPTTPPEPAPVSADQSELPAWLGELDLSEGAQPPGEPVGAAPPPETSQPEAAASQTSDDSGESAEPEAPEWLARFDSSPALIVSNEEQPPLSAKKPTATPEPQPAPPVQEPVTPRPVQLPELTPLPPDLKLDEPLPPDLPDAVAPFILEGEELFKEGAPDWLKPASEQPLDEPGLPPAETTPIDAGAPELSPAELPSWVQAMRPESTPLVAPLAQDETEKKVESAGPLVGLRGVLPAEPEVVRLRKSNLSARLQIPEKQAERIAILEGLLSVEGKTTPMREKPVISTQNLLRLAIFLVLLAAAALALLGVGASATLPQFTPSVFDASQAVNRLPGGAPVLLAVDYEPGFSAELEAAAAPLIDHLMLKGAYLILVSSLPTGPVQGERLVRGVSLRAGHHYQDSGQYLNLGFIPGGSSGVLAFAEIPQAVVPFATDGNRAWETEKLRTVQRLGDFALVVVLTESPEVARAWIEQVQPLMGATPLLMVTSAQAAPLVRPYYEANPRQVAGMVDGLAGGAGYESITSRPSLASGLWPAFSNLNLAAVGLMLLAGLLNLLVGALKHPSGKGSEARR